MGDIIALRKKIDQLDRKIAKFLAHRFQISANIGKLKKKSKNSILDAKREAKVINNVKKSSQNSKYVVEIYKKIIEQSRKSQK